MNASILTANASTTGSIAAQAVQSGIPINSALQSSGFKATGAGPDPTVACMDKCDTDFPPLFNALNNAACKNNCIANQGKSSLPLQNIGDLPGAIVSAIVTPVESFVTNAFPRVALFALALILTIVGFWLLVKG